MTPYLLRTILTLFLFLGAIHFTHAQSTNPIARSNPMPNPGQWPAPSYAAFPKPDLTVAADGSGDFKTIQAALDSIPSNNTERIVIYIKDGLYPETLQMTTPYITLRGQSREGTRIEAYSPNPKPIINLNATDCVFQNLSVINTAGVGGPHAFCFFGRICDHTVIEDCNVYCEGADTIALWQNDGHYYHARLNVTGAVDFICPHGWCYMTDCRLYEMNDTGVEAMTWHDGHYDPDQKFVIRDCQYDGIADFRLARHHHDALFFFLDCTFSKRLVNRPPYRVIYPLGGGTPTAADIANNKQHDASNLWGERAYYFNDHRTGGDYPWFKDNLASAPGSPTPARITAKWTFADKWDPENTAGPKIREITVKDGRVTVTCSENVTVKGRPRLQLDDGSFADYSTGSGSAKLSFVGPTTSSSSLKKINLQDGAIIATEAGATLRLASLKLP